MLPVYRYPQPHPCQKCHIPYYPNNYHPSWEAMLQTKPDTAIPPPPTYGPWSYGGSFGHPNPMESHACCNHIYPTGYYTVRPPHSHLPLPSPVYYHGPYTPYAKAYAPYHVPPHYSMEQPRYEYDKDMHGRHCCGCAHRVCKQKENKGVKIEEHEPETGRRENDSSAPVGFANNYPYPFAVVAPEYLKSKGSSKSSEFEPKIWDGWYPFSMKNENESGKASKYLEQVEDEKGNQNQNNEDKRAQFPLPVFWIPAYEKLEESRNKDLKEPDTSPKVMEEQPAKLKIIPANHPGNDGCWGKAEVMNEASGDGVLEKKAENDVKSKNIPVALLEEAGSKKFAETGRILKEIPVKQIEENGNESSDNNSLEKKSSSPRKASKLPPVCLRIDPLPWKKNCNGTSRSPSPPAVKKAIQNLGATESTLEPPAVDSKVCSGTAERVHLNNKAEILEPMKEIKVVEAEEKVGHMMEEVPGNCDQSPSNIVVPDVSNKEVTRKPSTDEGESFQRENTSEAKGATEAVEKKTAKKELSTTEATVLIQSFYRGFGVRKWEPLKKLKQIARVREQAYEVKKQIQTLESSTKMQKDEKQRILIGETIMSLLLQLDTIQGMHSSVRDIRKSVAKELVCLQERLDSLVSFSAGEEKMPEITNSNETGVQEAHGEGTLNSGYMPSETTKKLKEDEHQPKIEKQLPAEVVKECTESSNELESNNEVFASSLPNVDDEEPNFRATENVEEVAEVPEYGIEEPAESMLVVDKKPESEMEELAESFRDNRPCESHREHKTAVAAGLESLDIDNGYEPDAAHLLEGLPRGVSDEPKEDEHQLEIEEQLPAEVVKESTESSNELESNNEALASSLPNVDDEEPNFEAMENVKVVAEVPEYGIEERAESMLMVDKKPESEMESFRENRPIKSLDIDNGNEPDAAQLTEGLPQEVSDEMLPTNTDENQELVLQEVVDGRLPHDDSSQEIVEEKTSFASGNKELGLEKGDLIILENTVQVTSYMRKDALASSMVEKEHNEGVLEVFKQDELPICPSAEEYKLQEEPTGNHPNNVQDCEPVSLTGTEDGKNISQEETKVPDVAKSAGTEIGYSCLEFSFGSLNSTPIHGTCRKSEDGEQELPINKELPLDISEMGGAEDKKLMEENDKLRELVGKLIQEGKQQLTVISDLNERVKDLERKLTRKKKVRMRRHKAVPAPYIKP